MNSLRPIYRINSKIFKIDIPLFFLLLFLILVGLSILYSASNQNVHMLIRQSVRIGFAFSIMTIFSLIPPHKYKLWAPWIYTIGLLLLIAVTIIGKSGKGAQRWLDFAFFRFQPSEIMKLAIPMILAWYFDKQSLPLTFKNLTIAALLIFIPGIIIAKQPDLGTALMVIASGVVVVFLAGVSFRLISYLLITASFLAPLFWHLLHDYQKNRIITFLHPENDPLGTGYHIIQSKIAIGSGGAFGKGWQAGSQAHLNFLPEHATDFIFAVTGEEFGFMGCIIILLLMFFIAFRGLYIAKSAQTTFTRLLAGSLAITFFLSAFVNIGMVMGILPVVGVPLPLISYGGSAMVTFLASFGIIMSISTHKILFHK